MAIPPEYGSVVGLIGRAAFPCVIEVSSPESSSLFTGRTCISNEGMRWQSLYLVVIGKWAVFAPVIILGGIYAGIFTPSEAAAVAVAYGLFVGLFIYKGLTLKKIIDSEFNYSL